MGIVCVVCLEKEGIFRTICLNGHSVHQNCLIRIRMSHERAKDPDSDDNSPANCPTCRTPVFDIGKEPIDLSHNKMLSLIKKAEEEVRMWRGEVHNLRMVNKLLESELQSHVDSSSCSCRPFPRRGGGGLGAFSTHNTVYFAQTDQ